MKKILAFLLGLALIPLMGPTGGFPAFPQFQGVGIGMAPNGAVGTLVTSNSVNIGGNLSLAAGVARIDCSGVLANPLTVCLPSDHTTQVLVVDTSGNITTPGAASVPWKISAVKTADLSRNTTVTPTADPDLSVTVPVGIYAIDAFLNFCAGASGAVPGEQFATTFSGTLGNGSQLNWAFESAGSLTTPTTTGALVVIGATGPATLCGTVNGGVSIFGYANVTGAGTFNFKWAQSSSSATNTTLSAGSFVRFVRVN